MITTKLWRNYIEWKASVLDIAGRLFFPTRKIFFFSFYFGSILWDPLCRNFLAVAKGLESGAVWVCLDCSSAPCISLLGFGGQKRQTRSGFVLVVPWSWVGMVTTFLCVNHPVFCILLSLTLFVLLFVSCLIAVIKKIFLN